MSEQNLFEIATRQRYRFQTPIGTVTTEDLWTLPLTDHDASLDNIAIALAKEIREKEQDSFVTPKASNVHRANKLELVKHVIKVLMQERDDRVSAAARAQEKQKILQILEEKKDDSLKNLSIKELEKRAASL